MPIPDSERRYFSRGGAEKGAQEEHPEGMAAISREVARVTSATPGIDPNRTRPRQGSQGQILAALDIHFGFVVFACCKAVISHAETRRRGEENHADLLGWVTAIKARKKNYFVFLCALCASVVRLTSLGNPQQMHIIHRGTEGTE